MSQGKNQHFNQVLAASVKTQELQGQLYQKRQDLILCCVTGSAELQDKMRRECHDLLDLIIDNETTVVSNVVNEIKKSLE